MASYCGKNCDECERAEELQCRGCKEWQTSCAAECDIANCCKSKMHDTCETCSGNSVCSKLSNRFTVPDSIMLRREREAAEKEKLKKNSAILGKWLWMMFWLIVPNAIASFLELEFFGKAVNLVGIVISAVCMLMYGLFMLKLQEVNDDYKSAALYTMAAAVINGVYSIIGGFTDIGSIGLLFSIPAAIIGLIGAKKEYSSHAEVLFRVDHTLSEKWDKLWKMYVISIAATIGGAVLVLFGLIGLLITLAGVVLAVVVSIKQLIYLYNTAKLFKGL